MFSSLSHTSSKLRSLNETKFDNGTGHTNGDDKMSIKDISKRQKSVHRSSKLSKEIKEVNEYHLKEKKIFIEPDERVPQLLKNSTGYTTTSPNNLSKQRTKPQYNSSLSALRNSLPPFSNMAPKTASSTTSRSKPRSTSTKPSVDLFSSTRHSLKNMFNSSTDLKYPPAFKNASTEPFLNKISLNKDNGLVIVLRLPESMLHELSKVVTYGMEQSEREKKSSFGQNVAPDIPPGRMIESRKEKKDLEESLPTHIPFHLSTESRLLHKGFSKNLTDGNSSGSASDSNRRDIDKDKSNNSSESKGDVHINTPTSTTMPVKKDSPNLFSNNSDFIESLIREAASFQDISNDSTGLNKIRTTADNLDGRQQRKAKTYDAEVKLFKDMMAGLIANFTARIKSHPNFNAQQQEKAIAYMESVLTTIVSRHMGELVKEIHRKVAVKGRSVRDTRSLPNKYVLNIPSEHEPFYL